jgi:hypothetical protein
MTFITIEEKEKLLANGQLVSTKREYTQLVYPVIRLYSEKPKITYLVFDVVDINHDYVVGLYSKDSQCPKITVKNTNKLASGRNRLEKDETFKPSYVLASYLEAARLVDSFVEDPEVLNSLIAKKGPGSSPSVT